MCDEYVPSIWPDRHRNTGHFADGCRPRSSRIDDHGRCNLLGGGTNGGDARTFFSDLDYFSLQLNLRAQLPSFAGIAQGDAVRIGDPVFAAIGTREHIFKIDV